MAEGYWPAAFIDSSGVLSERVHIWFSAQRAKRES